MTPTSEELLVQIRNQITAYQMNVKSDNKAHRYNINDRAEAFTIPLLKLLFGWDHLQDLNKISPNFPGIDLGDYENRIAIQVTSDTSLEKVKGTITQFVSNTHYEHFDRLVVLMIQDRNSTYNQKIIDDLCQEKLRFNQNNDILDLSGLMQFIKSISVKDLKEVLILFQDETGFIEKSPASTPSEPAKHIFSAPSDPPFESGLLNLCEIGFPDTIYLGYWNFSKKSLASKKRNDRKLVQEALEKKNLKFAIDWVTIEKQIITFHDLRDNSIPLSKLVDEDTITELHPSEMYNNPFYRNSFVELLQRCLQQKLFHLGIKWQNQEKEYIFVPLKDEDTREIEWTDIKTGKRTVYKKILDLKDATKVYCHEHFAFSARFFEFTDKWFLSITPDWFYSASDGYSRAWYAIEDKRKYKKMVETNQSVSTHFRFTHSFLQSNNPKNTTQMNMFTDENQKSHSYEHLWIKDIEEVQHMPRLSDSEWRSFSGIASDDATTMF